MLRKLFPNATELDLLGIEIGLWMLVAVLAIGAFNWLP